MTRLLLTAATLTALFVAALLASLRLAGTSPVVWIDTYNDEQEVQSCLVDDSCTLTGMSTSIPGQTHAVAWLELRALLAWLGVGLDGAHVAIQVSNALAVVLVFHLATVLAGPLAGSIAAWLAIDHLDQFARLPALYNTSPMLFFGAVFVLVCTAAVLRPGVVSVALAALVAAVMANIHISCAMMGTSVAAVGLFAPRRRLALSAFGALVFAVATFAMAPPAWLHNVNSLLQEQGTRGHLVVVAPPPNPLMPWALFAVGAWVASFAVSTPGAAAYRRRSLGALVTIVPSLVIFFAASRVGINAEPKYIFQLKAACAVAAALPFGVLANQVLPLRIQRFLPFALAVALAFPSGFAARSRTVVDDERAPTVADVAAVGRILQTEHGWTANEMLRNVKSPDGVTLLTGLRQIAAPATTTEPPDDRGNSAVVLALDAADVPDPLPSSWRVVRRTSQALTVLVLMRSRIVWRDLMVCVEPADGSGARCEPWNWQPAQELFIGPLPPGATGWQGTLRLSVGLRPAEAGFVDEIFMPRMAQVCGGRISSIPNGERSSDQRSASVTTSASGDASAPVATLEWELGAPSCSQFAYDGMIPFFLEGDAATVRTLAAILRKQEWPL